MNGITQPMDVLFAVIFMMGIAYGLALGLLLSQITERWSKRAADYLLEKLNISQ